MHLLFDPVVLAVPGRVGLTLLEQLEFAERLLDWLKTDYGLGTGHARAIIHVIQHGDTFTLKHTTGTHRDDSGKLKLDGKKKTKKKST